MHKLLLSTTLTLCCVLSSATLPRPKVIDLSWSNPTIEFLEKNLADMEQNKLLDGLTIRISAQPETIDGKKYLCGSGNAWNKHPWKYELFADAIKRLKALPFTQFTDNFFYLNTSQADFDWLSDEDWANVAHNFGVAARVAKEAGLKGFLLDIEEYGKKFWNLADCKTDKTFEEVSAIARQRGRQFGTEVFREYPDIVLFMPFALTMNGAALSLPFMNGVLDVIPPTALIYEGSESNSYLAKRPSAYTEMQNDLRRNIRKNIRKENLFKARAQILLAPGFYLDAHFTHQPSSYWQSSLQPELDERGRVSFIARNFAAAIEEAEPYIWLYGEQACWWKGSQHPRVKGLWDDMEGARGLTDALLDMKYPERLLDSQKLNDNLVKDGKFTGIDNAWSLWQIEHDRKQPAPGTSKIGDGKACAQHVTNGCFVQNLPIKGGSYYFFICRGGYSTEQTGQAAASLCFKDAHGKWMQHLYNISLPFPKTGQTETVFTLVQVPQDAATVSVQCNVKSQGETGEIYFTEIFLCEL